MEPELDQKTINGIRAAEFHKLTLDEQQESLRQDIKLQREKDRLRNAATPSEYEKNRAAYIEYLLMCVRLRDWHGVSDAANDLRVLEAKNDRI